MKKSVLIAVAASLALGCNEKQNQNQDMSAVTLAQEWDKTFTLSEKVNHRKVTFENQFGLTLAADLYEPKEIPSQAGSLPAIAVSGPFGASKEQSSGLYAMRMAERGFVTVAFDPSFTGESGGEPRGTTSPDINTEDFMAAVDFLSRLENVDAGRIGIIGICGWGGIGLNAAAADTRIKASAIVTMYDMTRNSGNGYFDASDNEKARHAIHTCVPAAYHCYVSAFACCFNSPAAALYLLFHRSSEGFLVRKHVFNEVHIHCVSRYNVGSLKSCSGFLSENLFSSGSYSYCIYFIHSSTPSLVRIL